VAAVCTTLGIEPPSAAASGDEADLRSQAAQLLRDVPKDKLAGVLELLKR
jgi:hypothetical protein